MSKSDWDQALQDIIGDIDKQLDEFDRFEDGTFESNMGFTAMRKIRKAGHSFWKFWKNCSFEERKLFWTQVWKLVVQVSCLNVSKFKFPGNTSPDELQGINDRFKVTGPIAIKMKHFLFHNIVRKPNKHFFFYAFGVYCEMPMIHHTKICLELRIASQVFDLGCPWLFSNLWLIDEDIDVFYENFCEHKIHCRWCHELTDLSCYPKHFYESLNYFNDIMRQVALLSSICAVECCTLKCTICGKIERDLGRNKHMKYCAQCKCTWYCSEECQQIDWYDKGHQNYCLKSTSNCISRYNFMDFSQLNKVIEAKMNKKMVKKMSEIQKMGVVFEYTNEEVEEICENHFFKFKRKCEVCGNQQNLESCHLCGQVCYCNNKINKCRKKHKKKHRKFCKKFVKKYGRKS